MFLESNTGKVLYILRCLKNQSIISLEVSWLLDEKSHTYLLGLGFLALLLLSSIANSASLGSLTALYQNQVLVFSMILMNNVIVVSLILLGMRFYVQLVTLGFFKQEKYAYVIIDHPQTFAIIFAFIVLFLGVLRGVNLFFGEIAIELLPSIFLASAPIGIIEGYGVYLTIHKTLSRTITLRCMIYIFGIFAIAALIEVGLITILR